MAASFRCILILAALLASVSRLSAATAAEDNAFRAAEKEFQDGLFKQAEADLGDFAQKFPESSRLAEAFFFQAEARIKLGDYGGALNLLSTHQAQAGKLADEYLFWQAEAAFQKGDYQSAADTFARMVHDFPDSSKCLQAIIRAATALGKASDWPRVLTLLEQTNGVFQTAARSNPESDPLVSRGYLLMIEAKLAKGAYAEVEAALQAFSKRHVNLELDWQRQYIQCRLLVAKGQIDSALQSTTNLSALANATGQPQLQAESSVFQARILERLGRKDEAILSYQKNLADGIPPQRQREALLKVVELLLTQNRNEAAQVLERFLSQYPNADAADLALLTLGELRLRQQEGDTPTHSLTNATANSPPDTNYLHRAREAFQTLTTKFPQSPLFGKAQLDLGWCFWLDGKIPESQAAFQAAVEHLPHSVEQANAYVKLADAQFQQTNFTAAIGNYVAVTDKFAGLPEVRTNLFEPALYQIVRAGLASGDMAAATNALDKILTSYPRGFHADRAALLTGQKLGEKNPQAARKLFLEFAANAPNAPLLPELRLAIARTYEQEDKWAEAIQQYESWLGSFTNHPSFPQALYYCALANFRARRDTNALTQFTNFVAIFPTSELAPLAQWWVADYFMRSGKFEEAESKYQLCYQNTNSPPMLSYQAKMMAGRAAFAHLVWKDATQYFTNLTSDPKCPPELWSQAMFAYGDTLMSQDSTNRTTDLQTAIAVFSAICDKFPQDPQSALAWGEKAKCLLQLAQNAAEYEPVTNAFQQVLNSPAADAAARSIAQVGIGVTLEKIAEQKPEPEKTQLFEAALDNYLTVFYYEKLLRDGEKPDPFWTRKAGFDAARLLGDKLRRRTEAINILRRLQEMFPSLRLDERINALKAQGESAQKG